MKDKITEWLKDRDTLALLVAHIIEVIGVVSLFSGDTLIGVVSLGVGFMMLEVISKRDDDE